eukprot:TRINITY_DN4249_c0_g1_i2.p1 TRINITY_DN4249_c0_g1~~TRINITY_DN4249_c0_g1_i2.p1  ORF type:complete len:320 (-),score=94.50 TRINITY_DN4249_c0_g1_i2:66-1025(-)
MNPLTRTELEKVDSEVNRFISEKLGVYDQEVPLDAAMEIAGLRAMFGETYPDPVRVVCIGVPIPDLLKDPKNEKWEKYSIELCGGTHLQNVGDTKAFCVTDEDSVASGVRRIVAVTGDDALTAIKNGKELYEELLAIKKDKDFEASVAQFQTRIHEKTIPAAVRVAIREKLEEYYDEIKEIVKKTKIAAGNQVETFSAEALAELEKTPSKVFAKVYTVKKARKTLTEIIKIVSAAHPDTSILLGSTATIKKKQSAIFVSHVPADLSKKFPAGAWVKEVSAVTGGKGGGKPTTASGSGPQVDKINDAIARAVTFYNEKVG